MTPDSEADEVSEEPFLVWDPSYELNIRELDEEHRLLFELANELRDGVAKGKSIDILGQTYGALLDFLRYHFGTEESLMVAAGYGGYQQHKAVHDEFITFVSTLQSQFPSEDPFAATEFLEFLKLWFFNHIRSVDKYLVDFLRSRRVESTSARLELAYAELDRLRKILELSVPRPYLNRLLAYHGSEAPKWVTEQDKVSVLVAHLSFPGQETGGSAEAGTPFLLHAFSDFLSGPVSENHGFIDCVKGETTVAVFDRAHSPEDAVRAAIEIQKAHDRDPQEPVVHGEGFLDARMGIGIDYGSVLMGFLRGGGRYSTTMLGEPLTLALRLEHIAKRFRAPIVVSQTIQEKLAPHRYMTREIGTMNLLGGATVAKIFEVFDSDPPWLKDKKLDTAALLSRGMSLYRKRAFSEAIKVFADLLESFPEDAVALNYARRSHYFQGCPPHERETWWEHLFPESAKSLRRSIRRIVEAEAEILVGRSHRPKTGVVGNVSMGGMMLELDSSLRRHSFVRARILPGSMKRSLQSGGQSMEAPCVVLWNRRPAESGRTWRVGMKFVIPSTEFEDGLRRLLGCRLSEAQSCPLSPWIHSA